MMSEKMPSHDVPSESEYLTAWAHFIGSVNDLGAEISNVVRDPASGGFTYSLYPNGVSEEAIEAAAAELRTVEIPFVIDRLKQRSKLSDELLTAHQLHFDGLQAAEFGVQFAVYGLDREPGPRPRPVDIEEAGTFDDPTEAIHHARGLQRDEATVSVGGYPYWSSRDPQRLQSRHIERASFESQAGPEQTQYDHQRRHIADHQQRLQAILSISPAMIEAVQQSASDLDAIEALTSEPHRLSALQARHLLSFGLRHLTSQGRGELQEELDGLVFPMPPGIPGTGT